MKWEFEEKPYQEELTVVLQKANFDSEVEALITLLEQMGQEVRQVFPVKTADRIQMVKLSDLILVTVDGDDLQLYTTNGPLWTRARLYQFKDKWLSRDFVQVSKYSMLNIRHLDYLEASFSGNMTAFLSKGLKTSVSRRYLMDLEVVLGLR